MGLNIYWEGVEGIGRRCAGGCEAQVKGKGGNALRTTTGQVDFEMR